MSLRGAVVQGVVDAAFEHAQDPEGAFQTKAQLVGKLLGLLVPMRVVSREQLTSGIADVMAKLTDILVDFPKAESQMKEFCGYGLVKGTLKEQVQGMGIPSHDAQAQRDRGYVDVGYVTPTVAQALKKVGHGVNDKLAGTLLSKNEPAASGGGGGGGDGGVPSLAPTAAPAAVSVPIAAPPAPAPSPSPPAADDDDEAPTAEKKKKKKKKVVAADEED
jgi:hypothetical protein